MQLSFPPFPVQHSVAELGTHTSRNVTPCIFSAVVVLGVKLTITWKDSRLNVSDCDGAIDRDVVEEMWVPSPHMVSTSFIESIKTLTAKKSFWWYKPPVFLWHQELNIGVQCPFDFSYYPFDSHSCMVQFHSNSYTDKVVQYNSTFFDESPHLQHALKYDIEYRNFTHEEDFHIAYSGMVIK